MDKRVPSKQEPTEVAIIMTKHDFCKHHPAFMAMGDNLAEEGERTITVGLWLWCILAGEGEKTIAAVYT